MIRFGHVSAFWKGLKARMILAYTLIGICVYGLIRRYSLDQKFLANSGPTQFRASVLVAPMLQFLLDLPGA
jgi:hypothetical protein